MCGLLVLNFVLIAHAQVTTAAPTVPSMVGTYQMPEDYGNIAKFYDPYDNVVCYETTITSYGGSTISCVKL